LMSKASRGAIAMDTIPMTLVEEDNVYPLLPGSCLKGSFRSHAEQIVRTVLQWPEKAPEKFLEQLEVRLVDQLFGVPKKEGRGNSMGKGALEVEECRAKAAIPFALWEKLLVAEDGRAVRQVIENTVLASWHHATHVAIDRWKGSVAGSKLFAVLEPGDVLWQPLRLNLDLNRLPDEPELRRAAMALLVLVLQDLADGELPLGYGVNRGFGDIKVTKVAVRPIGEAEELLEGTEFDLGPVRGLTKADAFARSWRNWIAEQGKA